MKPNNPPAFPTGPKTCDSPQGELTFHCLSDGMMLRDYFACAAIPAIYAQVINNPDKEGKSLGADYIAGCAYILADAMLEERAK